MPDLVINGVWGGRRRYWGITVYHFGVVSVEVVAETMHMGEIACGETRIRTEAACIGARERKLSALQRRRERGPGRREDSQKQASLPPGGAVSTVECSPERNIECCPRD